MDTYLETQLQVPLDGETWVEAKCKKFNHLFEQESPDHTVLLPLQPCFLVTTRLIANQMNRLNWWLLYNYVVFISGNRLSTLIKNEYIHRHKYTDIETCVSSLSPFVYVTKWPTETVQRKKGVTWAYSFTHVRSSQMEGCRRVLHMTVLRKQIKGEDVKCWEQDMAPMVCFSVM